MEATKSYRGTCNTNGMTQVSDYVKYMESEDYILYYNNLETGESHRITTREDLADSICEMIKCTPPGEHVQSSTIKITFDLTPAYTEKWRITKALEVYSSEENTLPELKFLTSDMLSIKKGTSYYWKDKDRIPYETYELVKCDPVTGTCYVIASFDRNSEGYDLTFVGDRMKDFIESPNNHSVFKALVTAQDLLTKYYNSTDNEEFKDAMKLLISNGVLNGRIS